MPFQPRRTGGIGGAAGFDGERIAGRQLAHGAEERAGADVIPGAEQHALGGVPYAEGVVAEQLARAIRTPLGEGAEDQFGIGCLATFGRGERRACRKARLDRRCVRRRSPPSRRRGRRRRTPTRPRPARSRRERPAPLQATACRHPMRRKSLPPSGSLLHSGARVVDTDLLMLGRCAAFSHLETVQDPPDGWRGPNLLGRSPLCAAFTSAAGGGGISSSCDLHRDGHGTSYNGRRA